VKQTEVTLNGLTLKNAEWAMQQMPQTIADFRCERSAGGVNDYYSEGDFWWPNPQKPDGPYIKKDGFINPDNFVEHRLSLIRFSKIVGYLASAYLITDDEKYVEHAFLHINAWLVNPSSMMNPNLLYAQAIKGITTGRGTGIIDTIHLVEVAQGVYRMQNASCVDKEDLKKVKKWFTDYTRWLATHQNGVKEMNAQDNHSVNWVMQVAAFARLTGDEDMLTFCKLRFKNVLLPDQMAEDGSFPKGLAKVKPYSYALVNLDAMGTICQILSTPEDNLWKYTTYKGLNLKKGINYVYPYVKDKEKWPHSKDIVHWDSWPVAHPFLLFAAYAYNDNSYFELWKSLEHSINLAETERNIPIRNPLIWI